MIEKIDCLLFVFQSYTTDTEISGTCVKYNRYLVHIIFVIGLLFPWFFFTKLFFRGYLLSKSFGVYYHAISGISVFPTTLVVNVKN